MSVNQTLKKSNNLLETNVEIDPVGVVYNITGSAVEEFLYSYLVDTCKIDRVSGVRTNVVRDGSARPEMSLYVFIDDKSRDVNTGMHKISSALASRMEEGNYQISPELKEAMQPICRDFKINSNPREHVIYFKCSIFKVIGIMFAVDPRSQAITISEIARIKKRDSILTVIKTNKFLDREDSGGLDKLQNIISRIED